MAEQQGGPLASHESGGHPRDASLTTAIDQPTAIIVRHISNAERQGRTEDHSEVIGLLIVQHRDGSLNFTSSRPRSWSTTSAIVDTCHHQWAGAGTCTRS